MGNGIHDTHQRPHDTTVSLQHKVSPLKITHACKREHNTPLKHENIVVAGAFVAVHDQLSPETSQQRAVSRVHRKSTKLRPAAPSLAAMAG